MAEKYSGGGVTLMQLLMTDALGKAYPEIVQSLVLGPIGMTNSDLAKFAIEVQQTAVWRSTRVLTRASVLEMLTPVRVGDYAVGFAITKKGEGWYFAHGGSNWGFQCRVIAHRVKGYGWDSPARAFTDSSATRRGAVASEQRTTGTPDRSRSRRPPRSHRRSAAKSPTRAAA
jgi:CubicO group peptidase (beta-lactamase class C family)